MGALRQTASMVQTILQETMRILLIRLRLVGDVVFTTPAIRALRESFPAAHLAYLVESDAAPVVALNPHLDDVVVATRPRGRGRLADDWALGRRLRRGRYDLVIDFHGGPRSGWLTWASQAPRRIGYTVSGRSWMYTTAVDRPRSLRPRHSVENQWDLLAPLGGRFSRPPDRADDAVEMPIDPAAEAAVDRRLTAAGMPRDARIVVLHVSAGNPFRRWPAEFFVDLAVALAVRDPRRFLVLTSGPSDARAVAQVREEARARLGRTSEIVDGDDLDLAGLRALSERAVLFIGGDSGPLHIAATSPVPIVGLYGPTLPARSAPWRDPRYVSESVDVGELPCRPCDQRHCAPGDFRCLTRLMPDRVITAAERIVDWRT